jgi:drug/metabolite transporter (DMT)-like permease
METQVFLAVLLAAALHAGWNALLKLRLEPLLAITFISIAAGLIAIPILPFVPFPNAAAWPYILASLALHFAYYLTLGEAYKHGALSRVYPIARGTAPLMTTVGTAVLLGETLGFNGTLGVVLLAAGLLMLALGTGTTFTRTDLRSVGFAFLTACTIAAYTIVDGVGARLAQSAAPYAAWLFALDGLMMLAFGIRRWPTEFSPAFRASWRLTLAGGAMSMLAYAIAIWAMTQAPIALVGALRETSVLFAVLIGVVLLREPVFASRMIAAIMVVAGIVLIRLK